MNPTTRTIAAARRAEAVLDQYKAAIENLDALADDLAGDIDCFPVESDQFQKLVAIGDRMSDIRVEASAIEDAVLDIAFEITEAAKAAA